MKLSIIVPVYNEIATIAEIIRRVRTAPVQMPMELIFVDDCSVDGTREYLQKYINGEMTEGVEVKVVSHERNLGKARTLLTGIQRRWDEIGRIFPRDAERSLDDDLRKIEQALRTREDADWKSNNPETKARANDMTRQLTDAIEKLEAELTAAKKSGDKKAIADATDALNARKAWLKAVGG